MAIDFGVSKSWNNGNKLLQKFISGDPDSEIEMGIKTQGPRLSIEAWQRLEFAEDLSE